MGLFALRFCFKVFFIILLLPFCSLSQPQWMMRKYVATYSAAAVQQMNRHGIPASVILAQAIFESRCGNSPLAKRSNNHFGIKCHREWTGDSIHQNDNKHMECFRQYETVEESYEDHSLFLKSRRWYLPLFALHLTDYRSWCYGLKAAGYATCPSYAQELVFIIELMKLYQFDKPMALARCRPSTPKKEFMVNRNSLADLPLYHFAATGLLGLDERDIHLRSLDLLMEEAEQG